MRVIRDLTRETTIKDLDNQCNLVYFNDYTPSNPGYLVTKGYHITLVRTECPCRVGGVCGSSNNRLVDGGERRKSGKRAL